MNRILRVMLVLLLFSIVCSCATNKDVKEIKDMIAWGQEDTYKIKNRIDLLTAEIDEDRIRLQSLENEGMGLSSRAQELKEKIEINTAFAELLNHRLKSAEGKIRTNSKEIEEIKKEQQSKRRAIDEALEINREIKMLTSKQVMEMERRYEERRKYQEENGEFEK